MSEMEATLDRFVADYFALVAAEENLKVAKEQFRIVSETDLPEAMDAIEVVEAYHEASGIRVRVSDDIHINVTKKEMNEACNWFIDNGFPEIVKTDLTVSFGANEAEKTAAFLSEWKNLIYLSGDERTIAVERTIHGKTLKSFAFKKLRKGELKDLPPNIAVYVPRVASVVKE